MHRLRQGIDYLVRMRTAADANFINDWVAINQTARERCKIQDFLFERDDVDPDVGKARIDQGFLYRVDRMKAERRLIKLRRIGTKETHCDLMRDPAKWVVPVRIPDAEQVAATWCQHAIGLPIGAVLVWEKHCPELAHNG